MHESSHKSLHGTSHWCLHGSLHKVYMKVSRGIEVYMKDHWSLLSVHLYQLKIWKFTSKFAVNFTAEIAQNAAFKAHVCRLHSCLEITLHQNLHKSSHWKLKLVGYIVVCRSHRVSLFWHKLSFIIHHRLHNESQIW